MTKEQIIDLIDHKVAGQGNQLDLGGGVVEALKAILDIVPEGDNSLVINGVFSENPDTLEMQIEVQSADFDAIKQACEENRFVYINTPQSAYFQGVQREENNLFAGLHPIVIAE